MPKKTQRERVLGYVRQRKTGATRREIGDALAIPHPATCRRVSELLGDGELIETGALRGQSVILVAA